MLTYQHKDGRTQQVHEREKVKIDLLEKSGWKLVVTKVPDSTVEPKPEETPDETQPDITAPPYPPLGTGEESQDVKDMRAIAAAKDAETDARVNAELYDGQKPTPIREVLSTPDVPKPQTGKSKK